MLEMIEGNLTAILGIISTFFALFGVVAEDDKKRWIKTVGVSGIIAALMTEIPILLLFLGNFLMVLFLDMLNQEKSY